MSEYDEVDESNDSEGMKQVRAALKAKDKELKEALAKLATFESKDRAASLSDLLKAAGAERFAKFYPSDSEVDESHVKAWVEENADLFGIKAPEANAEPDQIQAAKQIAAASGGEAPLPTDFEGLLAQMQNASTEDEFNKALASVRQAQFGAE